MTWDETIALLHSTDWKGSKLGLERMLVFLHALGDPQEGMQFLHVAGTNGKGSVCAMLASILREAGYRTGCYISPHLFRMNERMTVNGTEITDEEMISLAEEMKPVIDAMEDKPTNFEMVTAMAFLYFHKKACEIVVLEVGLGGRLDATNVIRQPLVSVIMNLGLEHTDVLGSTLPEIAYEKAGIIKPGCDTVLYHQSEEAMEVVRRVAEERASALTITDPAALVRLEPAEMTGPETADKSGTVPPETADVPGMVPPETADVSGTVPPETADVSGMASLETADVSGMASLETADMSEKSGNLEVAEVAVRGRVPMTCFDYRRHRGLCLGLRGAYQVRNAMAAVDVIDRLRVHGYPVSEEALRRGLRNVQWPGRFEILSGDPLVIVDGAHNPNGVEALTESIGMYLPGRHITFLMGVMADKDYREMLRILRAGIGDGTGAVAGMPVSEQPTLAPEKSAFPSEQPALPSVRRFVLEMPPNDRALDAEALKAEVRQVFQCPAVTYPTVREGLMAALRMVRADGDPDGVLLCFGSLYQVGSIRDCFHQYTGAGEGYGIGGSSKTVEVRAAEADEKIAGQSRCG